MDVLQEIKQVNEELISWRRHIHENPEIGFDLDETCNFVEEKLKEFGLETSRKYKGTVLAFLNWEREGKTLALRADMDALPITEETGLPFASQKENHMHACGHDAHTAQLLAAAKVLSQHKEEIKGRVLFIFQPAEELGYGSVEIANSPEFAEVDEVLGCHDGSLSSDPDVKPGDLTFGEGPTMATMDKFTIDIIGRGAHGSQPESSIDPITIGAYIVTAIQEIISREVSPLDPAVISFGSFHSGSAFNIIPEKAHLEGTTRTLTPEVREMTTKRLEEISTGIGKTFGAEVKFEFFRQPPPVINTPEVVRKVVASASKLFPENVKMLAKPMMGGEDFAYYLEKKPGAFFFLYNPLPIEGRAHSHHNPKFALSEDSMYKVPAIMVQYVMDELGE